MGFLAENFRKICDNVNPSEYLSHPPMYAQGKWQCANTCKEDLQVIGNFIRMRKPNVILECGTFEARTTEYIFNLMRHYCPPLRRLLTIDVPRNIGHIDLERWEPEEPEDPLYADAVKVRKHRISLMLRSEEVTLHYYEGLTRDYLGNILKEDKPDFVYQDASHLQHLLEQEWKIVESVEVKPGTVICFDDMKSNSFIEWVRPRLSDWDVFTNMRERGQLWLEKV